MAKYRKKPVVIEAEQVHGEHAQMCNCKELVKWIGKGAQVSGNGIKIETLEGSMMAFPGDWIIKGVQGEFYPCKHDIFAATYELVAP